MLEFFWEAKRMKIPGMHGVSIKKLFKELWQKMSADDIFGNAAQLAYYFLLALFPLLIFLAGLLAYLPVPDLFGKILSSLSRVMPPEALKLISDNLKDVVGRQHGGLLSFGILGAIWAASAGVSAIIGQLNNVYDVEETRPYWRVKLISIGLTVAFAFLMLLASSLVFFGDFIGAWMSQHFGYGGIIAMLWKIGKWVVALAALFIALEVVYYFGPDVKQDWKWITPGSVLAVVIWLLASFGLSFYVSRFADYNATYGSLGAVIILMLWFYITGLIMLLGGEVNAIIEHESATGKSLGEKFPGEKTLPNRRSGRDRRRNLSEQLKPAH
jgi:membrane protein